jgi:protein-disulfide isomerase
MLLRKWYEEQYVRLVQGAEWTENQRMTTKQHSDLAEPVRAADHVRGAPHAPVTIVEYGDFECPMCRAAEPAVRMVLERSPNAVRLIYRHFPLESAHPHALMAAEAAEAAAAQGKFWEMHDLLIREGAKLSRPALDQYAADIALDLSLFKASLDDEIYRQRVREQMDGANRSHLRATPGFFINGQVCDVSGGMHMLADRVAKLL